MKLPWKMSQREPFDFAQSIRSHLKRFLLLLSRMCFAFLAHTFSFNVRACSIKYKFFEISLSQWRSATSCVRRMLLPSFGNRQYKRMGSQFNVQFRCTIYFETNLTKNRVFLVLCDWFAVPFDLLRVYVCEGLCLFVPPCDSNSRFKYTNNRTVSWNLALQRKYCVHRNRS